MQSVKLSVFDKQKLATAYMHLYDALVLQYRSKNMSCGESWYNALCEIKEILVKHNAADIKPAMDYLMEFHKTHNKTQSKKIMISPHKGEYIESIDNAPVSADVKSALAEFEQTITNVTHPNVLVTIEHPMNPAPYANSFYGWASTLPDDQIKLLENDPNEFARQYRKFILHKHK